MEVKGVAKVYTPVVSDTSQQLSLQQSPGARAYAESRALASTDAGEAEGSTAISLPNPDKRVLFSKGDDLSLGMRPPSPSVQSSRSVFRELRRVKTSYGNSTTRPQIEHRVSLLQTMDTERRSTDSQAPPQPVDSLPLSARGKGLLEAGLSASMPATGSNGRPDTKPRGLLGPLSSKMQVSACLACHMKGLAECSHSLQMDPLQDSPSEDWGPLQSKPGGLRCKGSWWVEGGGRGRGSLVSTSAAATAGIGSMWPAMPGTQGETAGHHPKKAAAGRWRGRGAGKSQGVAASVELVSFAPKTLEGASEGPPEPFVENQRTAVLRANIILNCKWGRSRLPGATKCFRVPAAFREEVDVAQQRGEDSMSGGGPERGVRDGAGGGATFRGEEDATPARPLSRTSQIATLARSVPSSSTSAALQNLYRAGSFPNLRKWFDAQLLLKRQETCCEAIGGHDDMLQVCSPCDGTCAGCGKHCLVYTCSKCKHAAYCSLECQRVAWANHRRACSATKLIRRIQEMVLEADLEFEKGVVASELPPGRGGRTEGRKKMTQALRLYKVRPLGYA
ncbi:hypothetical protein CYMTET_28478, partial [Cymbomonas tetramitiformis]